MEVGLLPRTAASCSSGYEGLKGGLDFMKDDENINSQEFDPRKALIEAKKAARAIVKERFETFGCAGHATRIRPIPLDAMAARYH